MDQVPVTLSLAALGQLVPVAAGLMARERLTRARALVLVWCTIQVTADLGAALLGGGGDRWIDYLATPLKGATLLWALSLWQQRPLARLTIRLAIPLFIAAVCILAALGSASSGTLANPMYLILGFGVAIYTLSTHGNGDAESRLSSDWFWMCGGLALFFGTAASLTPLDPALSGDYLVVKSLGALAASLALTVGALCPTEHPHAQVLSQFS